MMGNAYNAYINLSEFSQWIELFGLVEEDPITQKRILAIISGAILPLVALGFIKSLVDYIKPDIKSEVTESADEELQKDIEKTNKTESADEELQNDFDIKVEYVDEELQNDFEKTEKTESVEEDPTIEEKSPAVVEIDGPITEEYLHVNNENTWINDMTINKEQTTSSIKKTDEDIIKEFTSLPDIETPIVEREKPSIVEFNNKPNRQGRL